MKRFLTIARTLIAVCAIAFFAYVKGHRDGVTQVIRNADVDRGTKLTDTAARKAKEKRVESTSQNSGRIRQDLNQIEISTMSLIKVTAERLTTEEAALLLSRLTGIKDLAERSQCARIILANLCNQGLGSAAWELVDQNAGVVRQGEISIIFLLDKSPIATHMNRLSKLTDEDDRRQAFSSLIFGQPEEVANLDFKQISLSDLEKNTAARTLVEKINQLGSKPESAATAELMFGKVLELGREKILSADHIAALLNGSNLKNFTKQWEMVNSLSLDFSDKDMDRFRSALIPDMIQNDLGSTLNMIVSDQNTKYSYPVISRAIDKAYQLDPASTTSWLNDNLSRIDQASAQRLVVGVSHVALKAKDYSVAEEWANQLKNPQVKSDLMKEIQATKDKAAK